jgi:hypothetical protein
MVSRRSVDAVVMLAEEMGEVVGATDEMNRVGQLALRRFVLFDLGVLEEELVPESERLVLLNSLPVAVPVLPDAHDEFGVLVDSPFACPVLRRFSPVDGEDPLGRIAERVEV